MGHLPASPAPRLDFLDGLRGLAALAVVAHHYTAAFYPTSMTGNAATAHLPGTWESWFAASPVHVLLNFRICFFFLLSGLVLAESAARTAYGWRALLAQLVRRYVRLDVPVAVGIALAYGLLLTHSFYNQPVAAASGAQWLARFWPVVPTFRQFVGDALFGVLVRGETLYNGVLWTMEIEWRGSLLVLGALALAGGRRWRLAFYAALLAGWLVLHFNFYYVPFLLGLSLHDVYRRGWHRRLATPARRALIAGLLLVAGLAASHPQVYYQAEALTTTYAWMQLPGVEADYAANAYHTLAARALVAAVLCSARLQRLTKVPGLQRLGKRAFALYLTHFLVLGSGSAWLFLWLRHYFSYHASFGLMMAASLLVIAALMEVFYRGVDVPSHALARWLGRVVKVGLARLPTASQLIKRN